MEDFISYEYTLKGEIEHTIEAENIYEAMEYLVRFERVHPSQIKSIKEKQQLD